VDQRCSRGRLSPPIHATGAPPNTIETGIGTHRMQRRPEKGFPAMVMGAVLGWVRMVVAHAGAALTHGTYNVPTWKPRKQKAHR
jgi:hypothetical protein